MSTIPVSTVPAAIAALSAAISTQTSTDSSSILVEVGDLSTDLPNDYITIGEVRRNVHPAAMVGDGGQWSLEEDYEVDVVVSSWTGAGTEYAQQTTARAWQLAAYVETAVRSDPSLGGTVVFAHPMQSLSLGPVLSEDPVGLMVTITIPIHVDALI